MAKVKRTKYALTWVFILFAGAVMAASFVLAVKGKLSGDWVTITTVCLPAVMFATLGFQASNAYITGAAAKTGQLPKLPEGG